MYDPTTRVLTVLELLQSHPSITGAEIARRLDVDIRSARRYIARLEELGIPVTADRGAHGGYRLVAGYKMPPLMLGEDEAVSMALGLVAARRLGLAAHAAGALGAQAKMERAMPERLRDRVRAVDDSVLWSFDPREQVTIDPGVVAELAVGVRDRRRARLRYHSPGEAVTDDRVFDPYGIVCRRGLWYTIGFCHLRQDRRLFRVDRIEAVSLLEERFERPASFDALTAVLDSLGSVPRGVAFEVVVEATAEDVRRHISADVATVADDAVGGVVVRGFTDNVDWLARLLARIGRPLHIREPAELRVALRRHAQQLAAWAGEC